MRSQPSPLQAEDGALPSQLSSSESPIHKAAVSVAVISGKKMEALLLGYRDAQERPPGFPSLTEILFGDV